MEVGDGLDVDLELEVVVGVAGLMVVISESMVVTSMRTVVSGVTVVVTSVRTIEFYELRKIS